MSDVIQAGVVTYRAVVGTHGCGNVGILMKQLSPSPQNC